MARNVLLTLFPTKMLACWSVYNLISSSELPRFVFLILKDFSTDGSSYKHQEPRGHSRNANFTVRGKTVRQKIAHQHNVYRILQ